MLYELFHRLMVPVVTSLIVGTVWVVGWSRNLQDEANKKYWPALPIPAQLRNAPAQDNSLQKVLLKHN